jgi:hypothetical protein
MFFGGLVPLEDYFILIDINIYIYFQNIVESYKMFDKYICPLQLQLFVSFLCNLQSA